MTRSEKISPGGGRRRVGVLLSVSAAVLALDQLAKAVAVARLDPGRSVPVIGDVLQLRLIRNPGAAFSLATSMTPVLTVVAIVVVVVILWFSGRLTSLAWAIALGAVLGGALGTLSDRIFRAPGPLQGHVVDFIELPSWPVFNIADVAIVTGAVGVIVLSLTGVRHDGSGGREPDGDVPSGGGSSGGAHGGAARVSDERAVEDGDG